MSPLPTAVVVTVVYAAVLGGTIVAAVTGFAPVDRVSGPAMVILAAIATAFAARATRLPHLDERSRRAWRVLTASFFLLFATPLLFFVVSGARPFPQPGDGVRLGSVVVLFVGLQFFRLPSASRRDRVKALLDAAIVVTGVAMALWYLVAGPALTRPGTSAPLVVAATTFAAFDLLALFGIARVLLRGADPSVRRPLWLLAAGLVTQTVGDLYLGYMQAHVIAFARTPWQFVGWLTMHYLVALSAIEQCRVATAGPPRTEPGRGFASKLPYLGVAAGYALLAVAAVREVNVYPWRGLAIGAIVLTGLVLLRQSFAQRDSDDAAATDSLTGLANRARLNAVLARTLDRDARGGRHTGVLLIDLNGFKEINDTLGHQAGDALLVGVAQALTRGTRAGDLPGRLGGDEFAVVLPGIAGEGDAVWAANRLDHELSTPIEAGGRRIIPRASIGVAVTGPGQMGLDELIHRADQAMYRVKRAAAASCEPSGVTTGA